MTAVRYATLHDVPRVIELAANEHARSQWGVEPFDRQCAGAVACRFIETMGMTLLMSDGGYLAGMVQPSGFANVRMALEYAWYAEDGNGFELLDLFEQWAKQMGARYIVVHDYAGADNRLAAALNRRHQYTPLGVTLMKTL